MGRGNLGAVVAVGNGHAGPHAAHSPDLMMPLLLIARLALAAAPALDEELPDPDQTNELGAAGEPSSPSTPLGQVLTAVGLAAAVAAGLATLALPWLVVLSVVPGVLTLGAGLAAAVAVWAAAANLQRPVRLRWLLLSVATVNAVFGAVLVAAMTVVVLVTLLAGMFVTTSLASVSSPFYVPAYFVFIGGIIALYSTPITLPIGFGIYAAAGLVLNVATIVITVALASRPAEREVGWADGGF